MLALALTLLLAGPQQQAPGLHHRLPEPAPASSSISPGQPPAGRSSLPPDADGEYQFGETGEVVELYVENSTLHGYILKRAERSQPASTPLTYDFASASATNGAVTFTTKLVHGQSYSFLGSVVRGPSNSPATLGYYLLRGQMTLHSGAAADTRSVLLQRLGQH